jgi:hypothetical protein
MRYRLYASQEIEQQIVSTEEELIEALSAHGWDLKERAAREARERRQRRFEPVRQARLSNRSRLA